MPIKYVLTTVLGVALGSVTTYLIMKKGTEIHINEEIESYKEYSEEKIFDLENEVKDLKSKLEDLDSPTSEQESEEDQTDYEELIREMNYGKFSEKKDPTKPEKTDTVQENRPYVISADDYVGDRKYDKAGLTYYEKDGVVIDEDGDVVPDGVCLFGEHNLDRFGEFEEDSLFVRNDETETDYEVILDDGAYADYLYEDED